MDQLATGGFNPANDNLYWGYFPPVEGAIAYKKGYDIGPDFPIDPLQEGNPFRQKTPRLHIQGKEEELEAFYEV